MEPDQIDMMNPDELRGDLRRMLRWAESWKKSGKAWRRVASEREETAPDFSERAIIRAQTCEECASDILHNR
jgi:hypothetical protein